MHRVVPELIVENYRAGHYRGEFEAVGMFLDLSGFSTMTDVLMQHGQHGAEVLASLMHSVFDPLVESVTDYGGSIVGFAGDGILALYPVESDLKTTALRALTSAFMIQKRLAEQPTRRTIYETFSVSARIGLASGPVAWGILRSSDDNQAAYYFRGSVVDDSAEAEHHAKAGDILLTEDLCEILGERVDVVPCDSFKQLRAFRMELPAPARREFPPVDLTISRRFMPEEVIAYDVRGEFRQVVNLFMRFPNLSETQLHELMSQVFELRNRYGGLVSRLDFGDKGCNLLVLWGAPVAYENDIGRALNFLIDLKSRVTFPITSGVTYYIAHAGYLGSMLCEDYTCYGWGVNLASRFMMSAPSGETWVDDRIARLVSKRFETEFVGSQQFKGFAAEQKVHRLLGHSEVVGPSYQGEIVGRDAELAQLAGFVEPVWQKKFAGLLLVFGDAGIGKGRLVHEFRFSSRFEEKKILWAVCQSDQILRQSFNPLRRWLSKYIGLSHKQTLQERKQIFDAKLDDLLDSIPDTALAGELDRTRSILGALLDLRWEDSLYEQLDSEGRYNNAFLGLIALFKAESLRQPVVLFLEDLQFTDDDSRDFLPRLKRSILASGESYPIAIIVTTRPPGLGLRPELIDQRIDLRGLSAEAISQLTEIRLGGVPAPDLVELLVNRSEGNPYFAEQIVRYLQDESLIETSRAGWSLVREIDRAFLPGNIRSVLVARLDQLARGVRDSVQTASILGRQFEIPLLAHMWREDDRLYQHIAEAEKAAVCSPFDDLHYIFSHGLLRDAAYEMQMQARRKELHALAVDALEHLYGETENRYAEIAHHAKYAELRAKAQKYYTLAGKVAAGSYQNQQAVDYYTRALAFVAPADLETRFTIGARRLELYSRMGKRDLQWKELSALKRWAEGLGDMERLSNVLMWRASYYFVTGDYLNAIDCAQRAETYSPETANTELGLYTQLVWSLALLRLGRLDESMQRAQATLKRNRALGNRKEAARALTSMGLIALEQKEPVQAQQFLVEALEIARELRDLNLQARALNNLAVSEGSVNGDYSRARMYYEEAYKIAQEMGDRYSESVTLGNLGFVVGMQGDFVTARSYHEQALVLTRETGNRSQEIITLINLSAVAAIQNEPATALQYAQTAAEIAESISDRSGEGWARLYMGHAHLLLNESEMAKSAFERAIEIRKELDQPVLSMEAIAGLAEVYMQVRDLESAFREVEKIMAFLEGGSSLNGTEEPLRVYYVCYRVLAQKEDPRSRQVLQTAIQLLKTQLSKLGDDMTRTNYIENIPWRRAIWNLAQGENHGG
ncbi:MAG TPA: tetratricopeptide repeat protein [Anaerolineales bacterium]|nr:tetratricopeptide repeat protein [Anaerolineales bacterium]